MCACVYIRPKSHNICTKFDNNNSTDRNDQSHAITRRTMINIERKKKEEWVKEKREYAAKIKIENNCKKRWLELK